MRKIFIVLFMSILSWTLSEEVQAQVQTKPNLLLKGSTPEWVSKFLQTSVGKNFTEQDVLDAQRNCVMTTVPSKVQGEVVLTENFDLLTAGSEEAPAEEELDEATAAELIPDFVAYHVHQAGGKAYLDYVNTSQGDPGYLMTKELDLSKYQGVFKVTFKVKNANADVPDQGLQYFVLDKNPDNQSMISASSLPMSSSEWTECSFISAGGREHTAIMFFGWQGKVLVDGVTVEQLKYELDTPKNIQAEVAGASSLTISWDAVDNATSYIVEIYGKGEGLHVTDNPLLATTTTEAASATLVADFDPLAGVYVRVIAQCEGGESYPGIASFEELSVSDIDAPVALEGSDVSETGFTANWEPSAFANQYELHLIRTHEVTEDGEEATYFSDEFEKSPYGMDDPRSTVMSENGMPVSLDDYIDYPGWSLYLGVCATGYLGITDMYAPYGFPGALFGPVGDYSIGDGKAHIAGSAFSCVDDVVLKVGFGKFDPSTGVITYLGEPQEFTAGTTPAGFEVDINGGDEESQIIFEMVDSAEGGDILLFDNLTITSILMTGDVFTGSYEVVTLPYNQTSYHVDVPFTGNDKFDYSVFGKFGTTKSAESNIITVYANQGSSVENIKLAESGVTVYDLNGNVVLDNANVKAIESLDRGVYIVRQSGSIYKVIR